VNAVGPIFIAVGAIELAIGMFFYFRTRNFLASAVAVSGTVVEFQSSSGSEGGTVYKPVVSYQTYEGETRQFVDSIATNPPGFEVGETVPVAYVPGDPGRAKITKPFRLWFVAGLLSSMGLLFLVLGVVLALVV
jgi:Protein of unknown function (DUF3592)